MESGEFVSTESVVTPIYKVIFKEGEEPPVLNKNARNYLELHGKTAWIKKMKSKYKGKCHIKPVPLDRKKINTIIDKNGNIVSFLDNLFQCIDGVAISDIKEYLKEIE